MFLIIHDKCNIYLQVRALYNRVKTKKKKDHDQLMLAQFKVDCKKTGGGLAPTPPQGYDPDLQEAQPSASSVGGLLDPCDLSMFNSTTNSRGQKALTAATIKVFKYV